jgi:hypothetical protein
VVSASASHEADNAARVPISENTYNAVKGSEPATQQFRRFDVISKGQLSAEETFPHENQIGLADKIPVDIGG